MTKGAVISPQRMLDQYDRLRKKHERQVSFFKSLYDYEPLKSGKPGQYVFETDFKTKEESPTWNDLKRLRKSRTQLYNHMQSLHGVCSMYEYNTNQLDSKLEGYPDMLSYKENVITSASQEDLLAEMGKLNMMTRCCEMEMVQRMLREFKDTDNTSRLSANEQKVLRHCYAIMSKRNFRYNVAWVTGDFEGNDIQEDNLPDCECSLDVD
jgi:hypothetical protein